MTWFKKGSLFLAIFIALVLVLSPLFQYDGKAMRKHGASQNRVMQELLSEDKDTVDMVVLGDSESYTSMSPMEIWKECGITSYTCGQPVQMASETYNTLEKVFENQKPKVVMLETGLLYRNKKSMKIAGRKIKDRVTYYLPLFDNHDSWKSLVDKGSGKKLYYKGFRVTGKVAPYTGGKYMHKTGKAKHMNDFAKSYLDKIQKLCRDNGAKLVLYSAPSPKVYNYSKHNGIKKYAEKKGIPYVDLNLKLKTLGINWKTDTYDRGNHMNISGAGKVSAYMGRYIQKKYDIADKRGDDKYREWDEILQEYKEETEPMVKEIRNN